MKDIIHTNEQHLAKIRGLIQGVYLLHPTGDLFFHDQVHNLKILAGEVERSVDALEEFLEKRKALKVID